MKSYKLFIPSDECLPRKLCLTLAGIEDAQVEIRFLAVTNESIVSMKLIPGKETTIQEGTGDTHDRTTQLLSQLDMDSSGGFIPPEIAAELNDEDDDGDANYDDDDVVESSQLENSGDIFAAIPDIYSEMGRNREGGLDSSSQEECFVPATQQRISDRKLSCDELSEVIISSDEEEEEEDFQQPVPKTYASTDVENATESLSIGNNQSVLRAGSPNVDEDSEALPIEQDSSEKQSAFNDTDEKELQFESDESFSGEPMMSQSQTPDYQVQKKFIKKKNSVVWSSDEENDEDTAAQAEDRKNLPDLESEPFHDEVQKEEFSSLAGEARESPEYRGEEIRRNPKTVPRGTPEPVAKPEEVRIAIATSDSDVHPEVDLSSGPTGVEERYVEGTENQSTPRANKDLAEEAGEIPETEEQMLKVPLEVARKTASPGKEDETQESLRLTLLSEPEKSIFAPPGPSSANAAAAQSSVAVDETDASSLRRPATRRSSRIAAHFLESGPVRPATPTSPEENGHARQTRRNSLPSRMTSPPLLNRSGDGVARLVPVDPNTPRSSSLHFNPDKLVITAIGTLNQDVALLSIPPNAGESVTLLSPIPSSPSGDENESTNRAEEPGVQLKRGVPCVRSPEKLHSTPFSSHGQCPPDSARPTTSADCARPATEATENTDEKARVAEERENKVPASPAEENPYTPARIRRRRPICTSPEGPSQQLDKIVDSQEAENYTLLKTPTTATSGGPRKKTRQSTRKANEATVPLFLEPTPGKRAPTRARTTPTSKAAAASRKPVGALSKEQAAAGQAVPTVKTREAKCTVVKDPPADVFVSETVPDEGGRGDPAVDSVEVEEAPAQDFARSSTSTAPVESRVLRRPRRSKAALKSAPRKSELPDPYLKETIETEPPPARSLRSTRSSVTFRAQSSMANFSEEIKPEPDGGRLSRKRESSVGTPRCPATRSVAKPDDGLKQSTPKRSRTNSRSISASGRTSSENDQRNSNTEQNINSSRNESVLSSESSIGVNRIAKARIMFTGCDDPPRNSVSKLGLKLTDIMSQCNVVVAEKFTRTVKMMYAVGKGIPVVNVEWINASMKAGKVLAIDEFLLRDEAAEKKFNFNLENTLRLASESKFFEGWSFYVTKSCSPSAEQFGEMLSGSEAKVIPNVPKEMAEKTVIVTCSPDRKLLPKKPPVPLVSVEFVFQGILRHELDYDNFQIQ